MEVELIIFIGLAITIGILITGLLTGWDYIIVYDILKSPFMNQDSETGFTKMSADAAVFELYNFYSSCISSSGNTSETFYIEGSGTLSKADVFARFKEIGWCRSIQSKEQGCGEREDVQVGNLSLPRIVELRCYNNSLMVS